jgi:hypothetical protein
MEEIACDEEPYRNCLDGQYPYACTILSGQVPDQVVLLPEASSSAWYHIVPSSGPAVSSFVQYT